MIKLIIINFRGGLGCLGGPERMTELLTVWQNQEDKRSLMGECLEGGAYTKEGRLPPEVK